MIRRLLQPNMVRRSMAVAIGGGMAVSPGHPKGLKLPPIMGDWDFSTPAIGVPAVIGQCVYADNQPAVLRISAVDKDAFEHRFILIRPGDKFLISSATFTVTGPGVYAALEWIFPGVMSGVIPADGILAIQVTRP